VAAGALTVAWTPQSPAGEGSLCLVDGRPRVERLARRLGVEPDRPAEAVIAAGYARLGDAVVEDVEGPFTLLVWDRTVRQGLLARDRSGDRPLFLTESDGGLLFASEVRNLLAALRRRPAPDGEAMSQWLAGTSSRSNRTLYEGIRRLPLGHAVTLTPAGWSQWQHWRPVYVAPREVSFDDAARAVREAVSAAAERALEGARRPAVMLSGGLDSATVAATASASAGGRVTAYSGTFPGEPAADESARIAEVRDWLGIPVVEHAFAGESPLAASVEFMKAWEVPSDSPNIFIWRPLMRRAVADGVDVMLDGEGGDELFGCARYLLADLLRGGRLRAAMRIARSLPGMGEKPHPVWLWRAFTKYGIRPLIPRAVHEPMRRARSRSRGPDWLKTEAAASHRKGHDSWAWKLREGPRWWAELADTLTDWSEAIGAPDQFRRDGAMYGFEQRHPLRDPELVDLMLSLPPHLSFDPELDRPLARRAMRDLLPPAVLDNVEKPVFNPLLASCIGAHDRDRIRGLLEKPHPELARRVDVERARAMLEPGASRPVDWGAAVWRTASLECWLRLQEGRAPV